MLLFIVLWAPSDAEQATAAFRCPGSIIIYQEVFGLARHFKHHVAVIELAPIINHLQSHYSALFAAINVELHQDMLSTHAIVESRAGERPRFHIRLVCGFTMRLKRLAQYVH